MLNIFWSNRVSSVKYILLLSCVTLVAACGGGGSSSSDKGKSPPPGSSSSVAGLVANAGPDLSVNAGEAITLNPNAVVVGAANFNAGQGNLEVTGASAKATDIVAIAWTRIEGPVVALQVASTTSGVASFVAPSTGTEPSIKISYKLTLTTAAGVKAEDTVTFTILRVNQAPTVNAGVDQTIEGLQSVSLSATAADSDGSIASYQWLQTAGSSVVLMGAASPSLSFTAPSTPIDLALEFELTVTDNNGLSSKDKVGIIVTPENAPQVQLYFPSAAGVYKGAQISAAGVAIAKSGTISGVSVDIGAGPVAARVNMDGSWRVDGLAVPAGVAEFSLQVMASDSTGRTGKVSASLKTTGDKAGSKVAGGLSWGKTIGVAVDGNKNIAYVLATGSALKDVRLFAIDLITGQQNADISNFSDTTKGINPSALSAVAYDAEQHLVFAATFPADAAIKPQIISIDTVTGERKLVSDETRGAGDNLVAPVSLSLGANHILYVADNSSSKILAVDTATGNRSTLASSLTEAYRIDSPLHLVADTQANNRLFVLANASDSYILQLNLAGTPATSSLISNSSDNAQGSTRLYPSTKGIVFAPSLNSLFVDDKISDLVKVDVATGNRAKFLDVEWTDSHIAYDTKKQLLYLVDGVFPGLFVVDPVTGQKLLISRE